MQHIIKILKTEFVTHDTRLFQVEKPKNYSFIPGQATNLSINLTNYRDKKRPFTLTSLNSDNYLEFIIKVYKEKEGVTKKLMEIKKGDEIIIEEPFGFIQYRGKGTFIAGGAGITPFIAILRQLKKENNLNGNILLFSNKTEKDIILENELDKMRELKKVYTLTREQNGRYERGRINESFLKKHLKNFKQKFYVCGPITFVGEIVHILQKLGANPESIVVES